MLTDEQIEQERARLEPLIGPTRAGWYAEACDIYPGKDEHDVVTWACRYREMAREAGRLTELLRQGYALSTYAASVKQTGNTPEFMTGLVQWIETYQKAARATGAIDAPTAPAPITKHNHYPAEGTDRCRQCGEGPHHETHYQAAEVL